MKPNGTTPSNLPPIPQEWWDENRERFGAETESWSATPPSPCKHYFYRKTATEIGCKNCTAGWIDLGALKVQGGQIIT